jgi:DNA-binding response OmpR family regulator
MRIAILDHESGQLDLIECALEFDGHHCHAFTDGMMFLRELQRETFDLLVVDGHVSNAMGLDIVRWARKNLKFRVPILFMSRDNDEREIVNALTAGADDCVAKPIRAAELAARVRALLRRAHEQEEKPPSGQAWGQYQFILSSRQLKIGGEPIVTTQKEFDLALFLFRNMGRVVSRMHLLERIWHMTNPLGTELMSRSLNTHISRVRTLLRLQPESGYHLSNVYGQGYRLEQVGQPQQAQIGQVVVNPPAANDAIVMRAPVTAVGGGRAKAAPKPGRASKRPLPMGESPLLSHAMQGFWSDCHLPAQWSHLFPAYRSRLQRG